MKTMFGRFFAVHTDDRLHAAAHSHHPWPDATYAAHEQVWLDAITHVDDKWDTIVGHVVPAAKAAVADVLSLPDPDSLVFAPNTHQFLVQLVSSIPGFGARPVRVLTTDAEFHSAARQFARFAEAGLMALDHVAAQPYDTFPTRLAGRLADGDHDLAYLSHVHFDSGYRTPDLTSLIRSAPDDVPVVIDGYHAFMAVPVDLGPIADRVFYLGGGYKYAMAGEGCCFLHAPPGWIDRPVVTGWFAGFGQLTDAATGQVEYPATGDRFAGATFDPSGVYRLAAALHAVADAGWTVEAIHHHVAGLQHRFVERLGESAAGADLVAQLVPAAGVDRGNFLTFDTPRAEALDAAFADRGVTVDHRGDRLRIGFGIYHDEADIDLLATITTELLGTPS